MNNIQKTLTTLNEMSHKAFVDIVKNPNDLLLNQNTKRHNPYVI